MSPQEDRVLAEGLGAWFGGLRAVLSPGGTLVVGRSRSCDLSIRRSERFTSRPDKDDVLRSREFNRVSRIHCEISLVGPRTVEVRDLSSNGTWVAGRRVRGSVVVDLSQGAVEVAPVEGELGTIVLRSA